MFDIFDHIKPALQHIKSVELCLENRLKDAAGLWAALLYELPSLHALKLTFYHATKWLRDAARVANHCHLMENVTLRLELFESEWAECLDLVITSKDIGDEMMEASDHERIYSMSFPRDVKTITIAASVGPEAASAFENFDGFFFDWFFLKDKGKSTTGCQHFVWYGVKCQEELEWLDWEFKMAQAKQKGKVGSKCGITKSS